MLLQDVFVQIINLVHSGLFIHAGYFHTHTNSGWRLKIIDLVMQCCEVWELDLFKCSTMLNPGERPIVDFVRTNPPEVSTVSAKLWKFDSKRMFSLIHYDESNELRKLEEAKMEAEHQKRQEVKLGTERESYLDSLEDAF